MFQLPVPEALEVTQLVVICVHSCIKPRAVEVSVRWACLGAETLLANCCCGRNTFSSNNAQSNCHQTRVVLDCCRFLIKKQLGDGKQEVLAKQQIIKYFSGLNPCCSQRKSLDTVLSAAGVIGDWGFPSVRAVPRFDKDCSSCVFFRRMDKLSPWWCGVSCWPGGTSRLPPWD